MKKCLALVAFILILLHETAHAVELKGLQPVDPYGVFSTFSTESLAKGKVAFSAGAEVSIDPDLYRFIMKTAYGLSDVVELDMTLPYIFGSDVSDGFEDVAIGMRHRFFEEGKYGPSLAYVLNVSLPTGSERLTTDGRYGAGLVVSKRVGPVNGHMNFFYEKAGTRDLKDELTFLAGLDFAAAHNFKLLSELEVRKGHDSSDIDLIEGRFGYRIKTTDSIYTSFGAGFDFKRRDPQTRLMFSVTFVTPPEKKIKKLYEVE